MFQVAKWSGCRDMGQKLHFFEVFWLFREIQEGIPGIFLAHNHPRNLLNIFAFGTSPRYCFVEEEIRLKAADTHPSIHPFIHTSRNDGLINAILQNGNCAKKKDNYINLYQRK